MRVREAAQPQTRGGELSDGTLMIVGFNGDEPTAWIRSDTHVDVEGEA